MTGKKSLDPATNIALGARELAHYRDGGGVAKVTVRTRGDNGQIVLRQRVRPVPAQKSRLLGPLHHGPLYIDHGPADIPHRIGVLYYALARTMGRRHTEVTTTVSR